MVSSSGFPTVRRTSAGAGSGTGYLVYFIRFQSGCVVEMERGLVQVYTGNGKGKTTAALGLALRAVGHGFRVKVIQFLKGRLYGELAACEKFPGELEIFQSGLDSFVKRGEPTAEDLRLAGEGLEAAREAIMSGRYDLVVLDEINVAVDLGVLDVESVLPLIDGRPPGVELVLTGRNAPEEFLGRADLVTEMREVRHYYADGVEMRRGIEY